MLYWFMYWGDQLFCKVTFLSSQVTPDRSWISRPLSQLYGLNPAGVNGFENTLTQQTFFFPLIVLYNISDTYL